MLHVLMTTLVSILFARRILFFRSRFIAHHRIHHAMNVPCPLVVNAILATHTPHPPPSHPHTLIVKSTSPQPQTTDRRLHNRTPRPHRCRRRRRRLRREQEQNLFFVLLEQLADKLGPERSEPVHEERCVEAESLWDCVYARGEPVAGLWE